METITIITSGTAQGNPGPATIDVRVIDDAGTVVVEVSETIGNGTDNFASYYAVLRGLQTAIDRFEEKTKESMFQIKLDNELVKKQLNAESQIKEPGLVPYFIEIHNLRVSNFPNLTFEYIS